MASILETFAVVFSSETDELEKGAKKAKQTVDTLNTSLATTEVVQNKLALSFSNMIRSATGALVAIVSVGALAAGIKSAANYADRIGKLSEVLDISTGSADAWSSAVLKSGGTAESFGTSAKRLNTELINFATKGKSLAQPFFESLGVSMVDAEGKARKVIDVLPELADEFSKISKSEALGIGQKIGLDQGTILLLTSGSKKIQEMIEKNKKFGVVTEQNRKVSEDFNDQIVDLGLAFRGMSLRASLTVLPILTKILKGFEKVITFMKENAGFIKGTLIGIGIAISAFLIPKIIAAVAASWLLIAPYAALSLAILSAIAVFGLLYDDVTAFFEGHNSMLGEAVKRWPRLSGVIKGVVGALKLVADYTRIFGQFLIDWFTKPQDVIQNLSIGLGRLFDDFISHFPDLKKTIDKIGDAFSSIGKRITGIWGDIVSLIKSSIDFLVNSAGKISELYGKIKGAFTGKKTTTDTPPDSIDETLRTAQSKITAASNSPLNSQLSNFVNDNKAFQKNTSVNLGSIVIHTQATDTKAISAQISTSLQAEISRAISNSDDGVMAG